ncbi:MAG: hypothetical protein SFU98_19080 [Leptospiraceae bacterium]|nr:hypothetical protein [Leptospiraceae bacterium]
MTRTITILSTILFFVTPAFAQTSLNGFGDTPWGSSFDSVREKFVSLARNPNNKESISILNETKDKLLVVKRNTITYIYRFYNEPEEVTEVMSATEEGKKTDHKAATGLFSVGVQFSPVASTRIKESLNKYGKPTKEYLVENSFGVYEEPKPKENKSQLDPEDLDANANQKKIPASKIAAALIWDLSTSGQKTDGGFIVQWNEPYQKKMYSKRIDYFSSELSAIINSDYKRYFSARETKIILDLLANPFSNFEEKEKKTSEPIKVAPEEVTPKP